MTWITVLLSGDDVTGNTRQNRPVLVRDDDLDAAIALPAFGCVVGGDRVGRTVSAGNDARSVDSRVHQRRAHRGGAAKRQLLVDDSVADIVGKAFYRERAIGMLAQEDGEAVDDAQRAPTQLGAAGIEEHVLQSDHRAAIRRSRLDIAQFGGEDRRLNLRIARLLTRQEYFVLRLSRL